MRTIIEIDQIKITGIEDDREVILEEGIKCLGMLILIGSKKCVEILVKEWGIIEWLSNFCERRKNLHRHVIWFIGNIAGYSNLNRVKILQNKEIMLFICKTATSSYTPYHLLERILITLSILCRGKYKPHFEDTKMIANTLILLLKKCNDTELLTEITWALYILVNRDVQLM